MIVTVGNIKGGIGKSTLSANLAVFLAKLDGEGSTVAIDSDRQGTMRTFCQVRQHLQKSGVKSPGTFEHVVAEGKAFAEELSRKARAYKNVIVDAGGKDNIALRAALVSTNKLIVPIAPRCPEVWAIKEISELIEAGKQFNTGLDVYSVLNLAYSQGEENADVMRYVKQRFPALNMLRTPIVTRKAWAKSLEFGYSITDKKYRNGRAVAEFWQLLSGMGFTKKQIQRGLG